VFPNLGTKGTGEPVVQPAERTPSVYAHRCFPTYFSKQGLVLMLLAVLALSACSTPPSIPLAYNALPSTLPAEGGTVSFFWRGAGGDQYTLTSDPPLEGLPLHTSDTVTTLKIRGNVGSSPTTYRFTLEATGPKGRLQSTQTVEVAAQQANAQTQCPKPSQATLKASRQTSLDLRGVGSFDAPHQAGHLIVYSGSSLHLQRTGATASLGIQRLRDLSGGWTLYQSNTSSEAQTAQKLVQVGYAQYVQPEYLYEDTGLAVPPSNQDYSQQSRVFQAMNWEKAWQSLTPGCSPPVVAVVDTGFFTNRADLSPNLVSPSSWLDVVGQDMSSPTAVLGQVAPARAVPRSHGTGIAGIIAATTNDGSALAGAAYNLVKVLPIKVFDAQRHTGTLQIAQALEYAAGQTTIGNQTFTNPTPAQVINLSLASRQAGFSDPYLESVLQRVTQQGLVVVASSGNAGNDSLSYPASSANVIAVGASDNSGNRAQWGSAFGSNYGPGLAFVAPGSAVPTLYGASEDAYANSYGTSAAAPFISTAVALYMYQHQRLSGTFLPASADTLAQVRQCLQSAAQHTWQPETGYGLVDVAKVVNPANPACYK